MAAFNSEAAVYQFLGGVFRLGPDDPDPVARLEPTGVVLRITYTEPDAVITVDMAGKELHEGAEAGPTPNEELFMSADTGNRFWLGKVVLPAALAKLLEVLPPAKQMFGPYRELGRYHYRAERRDDGGHPLTVFAQGNFDISMDPLCRDWPLTAEPITAEWTA